MGQKSTNLKGIRQIGTIFNSHGIKGEVKVASLTSYPEIFYDLEEVLLIKEGKRAVYPLARVNVTKDHWLFKLDGIEDLEEAKRIKNSAIYVEEEKLKPLAEDEFRISDLLQAKVFSTENEYLGVVTNYFENGEHGICEVWNEIGGFLFPTTKEVLKEIVPEERVIIHLLPDLRELNTRTLRTKTRSPTRAGI